MLLYINVMSLNTHFKTNTIFCYGKKKLHFCSSSIPNIQSYSIEHLSQRGHSHSFHPHRCSRPSGSLLTRWSCAGALGTDVRAGDGTPCPPCSVSLGALVSHSTPPLPREQPCPQPAIPVSSFCVHRPSCSQDSDPNFGLSL